jgi:hypothetical protein
MKRRVYCLAVRESLSSVDSLESFRATLTKNLSKDCCFWENRLNCKYVILSRQTSSTRIAKHRSFIKLNFRQNFCLSCKTLADQVARNPRFHCIYYLCWPPAAQCEKLHDRSRIQFRQNAGVCASSLKVLKISNMEIISKQLHTLIRQYTLLFYIIFLLTNFSPSLSIMFNSTATYCLTHFL